MARAVRDLLLRLTGDPSDAEQALHDVAREVAAFDKLDAEATVDVNTTPAQVALKRAAEEVKQFGRLSESAKLDLQTTGVEAQITRVQQRLERLSKQEYTPKVQMQIASAVAQLDRFEVKLDKLKAKRVEVKVDVDTDRDRIGHGAGGLVGGLAEGAGTIARGLATAGTTALTFFSSLAKGIPIVGGIGQAFAGLGTSAAAAGIALVVIVPIAIALVGALTLLGGAIVALGASLLSAAAGVGVLATAFAAALGPVVLVAIAVFARFAKILEAVKQREDQAASSAQAIHAATQRQADAQSRLADAHKTALQAAVEGYRAQRDAAEEVSDAVRGIADAELNREQAGLDLKKDEQALRDFRRETGTTSKSLDGLFRKFTDVSFQPKDLVGAIRKSGIGEATTAGGGSTLDLAQLVLNVRKSKQGIANADDAVSDATTRANDARDKEAEFLKNGIAAYPPYAAALAGVAAATKDVDEAQKNLNDTRAEQGDKLKELGPKEKQLADVIGKVKQSLADAFRPATDRVFAGVIDLLKQIDKFAKDASIRRALGGIGDAIGKVLSGFGRQINTREFKQTFRELAAGGRDLIRLFGNRVFRDLLTLFLRIARSALPPLLRIVRQISERFHDWVEGLGQKGVEGFVRRVIRSFNAWKGVIKAVWDVVKEFFGDANDSGDTLADHIADILRDFPKVAEREPRRDQEVLSGRQRLRDHPARHDQEDSAAARGRGEFRDDARRGRRRRHAPRPDRRRSHRPSDEPSAGGRERRRHRGRVAGEGDPREPERVRGAQTRRAGHARPDQGRAQEARRRPRRRPRRARAARARRRHPRRRPRRHRARDGRARRVRAASVGRAGRRAAEARRAEQRAARPARHRRRRRDLHRRADDHPPAGARSRSARRPATPGRAARPRATAPRSQHRRRRGVRPVTAFAVAHGVLGVEAFHIWNGVVLNQQKTNAPVAHPGQRNTPRYDTVWPLVRFDRITGLHSLPEADDNRAPATGRLGEIVYPSLPRGRTITYEGFVYGRNLLELRGAVASLRGTFSNRSDQGMMTVRPHPAVGGPDFYYYARPLAFDVDDEQVVGPEASPSAFQRHFVLSLRQADPRFYHGAQVNTGDQAAGSTPTVTNAGSAPTDFGVIADGPIPDDFVIERYGNPDARKLLLNNVGLAGGQQLFVNFGARSIRRIQDNADFSGRLVFPDSNWWDDGVWGLHPGATMIRCAGGGTWHAWFNSASW